MRVMNCEYVMDIEWSMWLAISSRSPGAPRGVRSL